MCDETGTLNAIMFKVYKFLPVAFALFSQSQAETYILNGDTSVLLQYTNLKGKILGNLQTTVLSNKMNIRTIDFDISGIRNGNNLSFNLIEESGYSIIVTAVFAGRYLDISFKGTLIRLRPASRNEYLRYIAIQKQKVDTLISKERKVEQTEQARQNRLTRDRAALVKQQTESVKPIAEKLEISNKQLVILTDQAYQNTYTMSDILPRSFYERWNSILEKSESDLNNTCTYLAELRLEEVTEATSAGSKVISIVQKNLEKLKKANLDVRNGFDLYKTKLRTNPFAVSRKIVPDFKDTEQFIRIMTFYITSLELELSQQRKLIMRYGGAKLKGDCEMSELNQ